MGLFRQFHQVGTTVLVATHDRALIDAFGGRVVELDHGALVRDDRAADEGSGP